MAVCNWNDMTDFLVSFNLFGEFDHFEDEDAAEEKQSREYKKGGDETRGESNHLDQRCPNFFPQRVKI